MEHSNVSIIEGAGPGQKPDTHRGLSRGSALGVPIGKKASTPDRLRVLWIAAIIGAVVVSVVVNLIIGGRSATTERIASEQVSVIVGAQQVQTSIAEADAAAANEFLADGKEEQEQRAQYQTAIEEAGVALTEVASKVDDDDELLEQVKLVEKALVKYSGLIESARANNRQNYPIGAAYLSAATAVLDQEVYPASDEIANGMARQYRGNYNDQVGAQGAIYLLVLAVAVLALFIFQMLSHRYLSRKFRRTINIPYAIGILLTVGVIAWGGLAITTQNSNIVSARQDGYENVRTLINLRAQGLRSNSEESQYLIARGAIPETSFAIESRKVTVGLNELSASDSGSSQEPNLKPADISALDKTWAAYQSERGKVLTEATTGERDEAINLALNGSSIAFQEFDNEIAGLIDANKATFDTDMDAASSSLRFLSLVGPLFLLIGSFSIYFGMQQRIREYR